MSVAGGYWHSGIVEVASGMLILQVRLLVPRIGFTTAQMQQALYYAANNWSGTIWTIDEGHDYPILAWENAPAN